MRNPFEKTPFFLLLLPLVSGIVLEYYFGLHNWSILFLLLGAMVMLLSYFIPFQKDFKFRWFFGFGMSMSFIAIGLAISSLSLSKSELEFSNDWEVYKGIAENISEKKDKSANYEIYLPDMDKKILAYLEDDEMPLRLGDEFVFYAKLNKFENRKRPNAFDYVSYMKDNGFAAWTYIAKDNLEVTGKNFNLRTRALVAREKILGLYENMGLNDEELSVLSALTLGYKDKLDEELIGAFRKTGTVHVLSVSGLHVGLIYSLIIFLLSPLRRITKSRFIQPSIVILLLWMYAFVTGLSPSVLRAAWMLSIFCGAEILNRRAYSMHSLYIAAFFILIISPLSLFNIGFQLSFSAVFSILYFHNYLVNRLKLKSKYLRKTWQLFTLSIAAQLGTFPLCLYYFGSFPTYFFISNMIVVPLIGFVIYSGFARSLFWIISNSFLAMLSVITIWLTKVTKLLLAILVESVNFFEKLPFSSLENIFISLPSLIFLILTILSLMNYLKNKRQGMQICTLFFALLLFISEVI